MRENPHNSNAASGDYTVRLKQNLGDFCGFTQPPTQSGNSGFAPPPVFRTRAKDPEFHLKAHLYLDEHASAQDWLDWASAVG